MSDQPDAWDECAACGHDREDHDRAGCRAAVVTRTGVGECPCLGFVEEDA